MTMGCKIPSAARIELVRLHLDRPHMHGFHRFLAVRPAVRPASRRVARAKLLHLTTLHAFEVPASELARAERLELDPAELERFLLRRMKELKGRRFSKGFVRAVILRMRASRIEPVPAGAQGSLELDSAA